MRLGRLLDGLQPENCCLWLVSPDSSVHLTLLGIKYLNGMHDGKIYFPAEMEAVAERLFAVSIAEESVGIQWVESEIEYVSACVKALHLNEENELGIFGSSSTLPENQFIVDNMFLANAWHVLSEHSDVKSGFAAILEADSYINRLRSGISSSEAETYGFSPSTLKALNETVMVVKAVPQPKKKYAQFVGPSEIRLPQHLIDRVKKVTRCNIASKLELPETTIVW